MNRPSKFRFSLATMIWASLLVGAVLWIRAAEDSRKRLERENAELQVSLEKERATAEYLREHYGASLKVTDQNKIHVRAFGDIVVQRIAPLIWSWRVHLPGNRNYRVKLAQGDISGELTDLNAIDLVNGYNGDGLIYFALQRNPSGTWGIQYSCSNGVGSTSTTGGNGLAMNARCTDWLEKGATCQEVIAGSNDKTEIFEGSGPVVLARIRLDEPFFASEKPFDENCGFVLWIEAEK